MKNKGIKAKVTNLVMIISLTALVLVTAVAGFGIYALRIRTVEISSNLGGQAADGSKEALETLALNQLVSLTKSKTIYADAKLSTILDQTMVISDIAADIYNNPAKYSDIEVYPPDAANEGIVTSQLLWAEGAELSTMPKLGNIAGLLDTTVSDHSGVFCAQIGTEDGFIIVSDSSSEAKAGMTDFDPRVRSWYSNAKAAGEQTWSDLVDDAYGRGLGIVCTNPIYDDAGAFRGVAGVSMLLTELSDTITNEELGSTSYAFAIDGAGNTVIMPNLTKLEDSINLLEAQDPAVREMAGRMVAGESGVTKVTLYGREVYAAYAPLEAIDWSICTVISVDEILRPANDNNHEILSYTQEAVSQIDSVIMIVIIALAAIILLAVITVTIISDVFSKRLTKPIETLTASVRNIDGGELRYKSEIKTGDEIEVLSDTFETMTNRLAEYIDNITHITAEKERMSAELDIAAKIQEAELPRTFPAFPDHSEFDIYALMNPAKEVGGDFYDFFLVDENHLAVVIADVSGKGIPGAMFMMLAKTHIKTNAGIGKSPADILAAANNDLCENNDAEMFLTAFIGILEISTGKFVYANAGHNPPLLKRSSGRYEWLKVHPGFILAGINGVKYRQSELYFGKGDILFLYTDGVNEAADVNEQLFGNDRLEQALNEASETAPKELINIIHERIMKFSQGAEQADDITMVALQYFSPKNKEQYEISLPADREKLQHLLEQVNVLLEEHNCPPQAQYQLEVCIEEIFVNIASYAYGGKPGPARVVCEFRKTEDGAEEVIFTFCDDGVPYNPLNRETPDVTLGAEDREIGGLGIYMTRKMMDRTEYEYKGENIFRMYKRLS